MLVFPHHGEPGPWRQQFKQCRRCAKWRRFLAKKLRNLRNNGASPARIKVEQRHINMMLDFEWSSHVYAMERGRDRYHDIKVTR